MRDRFFGSYPQKLDDLKQRLLIHFQAFGLQDEHLTGFNVRPNDGWHDRPFIEAMNVLLVDHKLPPKEAVAELNNLYFYQAFALSDCYKDGLRGDHLRNWRQGSAEYFYMNFWQVLVKLIQDKKVNPELAVSLLDNQTSANIEEIEKVALEKLAEHKAKNRYMNFGDDQYGSPVVDRFRPA